MKRKILFIAVAALMALCVPVGCGETDGGLKKVRISEVAHTFFYAPMYIADKKGFFEEEGLKVTIENANGADKVMTALTSKSAEIGLMGPEAAIYVNRAGIKDAPVIFAQLTQRDGSFLVGRTAQPDFKWSDLTDKHVLAGRPGGVPAMTLQYICNVSYNLFHNENINLDTSVPFANMGPVFAADASIDYTTLFEPAASQLVAEGKGFIVASVGAESGEVPYTAFSANRSYVNANPDTIGAFIRAIVKGYNYMNEAPRREVAEVLERSFAGTPLSLIEAGLDSYLAIDAWTNSPIMKRAAFDRLQDIMINAGELEQKVDFDEIVDNSYAQSVLDALSA
ncbi:MAG: ABC transporter substrate-binding protein [Clostridiales bacterium]|jgi:NitT/TauT family transport system substrate-binding protein|nr:ABC transporter substrate-binding protein [Clostridiales bacterium]